MNGPILVTGAAGFIGSHVAAQLVASGHSVVGLDDLSGGFQENVPNGVQLVVGTVVNVPLVTDLFQKHRFEHVFHLAAFAAEELSHCARRLTYETNVLGSANLINAAVNCGSVRCFVFTSSIAVYGAAPVPMTEETMPQPRDPYGVSKYAVELDLRAAQERFGLNSIVFRPHNVYGEKQNLSDPTRNVVGIFMNQAMSGRPLTIFGDGGQTRAFSHVDAVASIIASSVEQPAAFNQVFNIGADQPCSILELARLVSNAMEVELRTEFRPARAEVVHAHASHEKLRAHFGDQIEAMDLPAGIARMARWARGMGARPEKAFRAFEISEGQMLKTHSASPEV